MTSLSSPQVSIIIVNYKTSSLVHRLLNSIFEYVKTPFEVIVADNSPLSDKFLAEGRDAHIQIVSSGQNIGFAAAINRAAKKSSAPFLLFANPDCRLLSDIISPMVTYLEEQISVAACSPRLVDATGRVHSCLRRFPNHKNILSSRGALFRIDGDYTVESDQRNKEVEAMAATFMLIRRQVFAELCGFDERFWMYVEDTDLCLRLHQRGYKIVYLGTLEVEHLWGAATAQKPIASIIAHHRSVWKYFRKHYPESYFRNLLLAALLLVNCILAVWLHLLQIRRRQ